MPQSSCNAQPSPRYRIVIDPPLPSRDGILRADDAEEQRRLRRRPVNRSARFLLRHVPAEIAALVTALAILSLPICATLIALDAFRSVLDWDLWLPLWSSLFVLVIWTVAMGTYLAARNLTWTTWLISMVMATCFGAVALLFLFVARFILIFLPIIAIVVFAAISKGAGPDILAFVVWFALLIFGPMGAALLLGGGEF